MTSFVLKIVAYHGEPKIVNNVPVRKSVELTQRFVSAEIVNDPADPLTVIEVADTHFPKNSMTSSYSLDQLIDDFEDEYDCKVNIEELSEQPEVPVHEFNVFEPSWSDESEANDIINDLNVRLTDWITGHPTGQ